MVNPYVSVNALDKIISNIFDYIILCFVLFLTTIISAIFANDNKLYIYIFTYSLVFFMVFLFLFLSWGATPGKKAVGLQVVNQLNEKLSFIECFLVSLVVTTLVAFIDPIALILDSNRKYVFIIGWFLYAILFIPFNEKCLIDGILRTKVIYRKGKESSKEELEQHGIKPYENNNWLWHAKGLLTPGKGKTYIVNDHYKDRILFYSSKYSSIAPIAMVLFSIQMVKLKFGAGDKVEATHIAVVSFLFFVSLLYFLAKTFLFYKLTKNSSIYTEQDSD